MRSLNTESNHSWLAWFLRGMLLLCLVVLFGRLAELQIIKGEYYRSLAEGNRIRRVPINAARGNIYALGGELLAQNEEVKKTVHFDPVDGYEKINVTDNTAEDEVLVEWLRHYDLGERAGHLTGYLGEANEEEVNRVNPACPDKGPLHFDSTVGRIGLERQYECLLRGVDGEEMVEVDTMGRRIRLLGRKNPIKGDDLYTTIDYKLQKKTAEVMGDSPGAVIVSDPYGKIFALYSSPSFDPNHFIDGNASEISKILTDSSLPLFNRAISGAYHPGSVYKIVTSIAGLEVGAIEPDFTYVDTGIVTVDEYSYTNWYLTQFGGVEGEIDLVRALARSTDTFYYKLGEFMGVDALVDWSRRFGLDKKTGIDLPGEARGLLPSPEWKKAVKGERWYLGNTYHLSIGQGDLESTPLQSHTIMTTMAADGKLCRPYLNANLQADCVDLGITPEYFEVVEEGLIEACAPGGTGAPFFDFEPAVACKTGTAETMEENVTHAWFVVYAPIEDPKYVMTVLVEKGGGGSGVAAPIARELMDYLLNP